MKTNATLILLALLTSGATAQQTPFGEGFGRRISQVLEDLTPLTRSDLTLGDLADAAAKAIQSVDKEKVESLNRSIERLRREEDDILQTVKDLEDGLPVDPDLDLPPLVAGDDLGPDALERELAVLTAQEARIIELERQRQLDILAKRAQRQARRPTAFSRALLGALTEFPEFASDEGVESPVAGEPAFPDRVARVLFRTGDFAGALRNFRKIDPENWTRKDTWMVARCLQEVGKNGEAVQVVDRALAAAGAESMGFWLQRLKALKSFLEKDAIVSELLQTANEEKNR